MKNNTTPKASQGLPPFEGADSASTSLLTPYCVLTEQLTAASTASGDCCMRRRARPDIAAEKRERSMSILR